MSKRSKETRQADQPLVVVGVAAAASTVASLGRLFEGFRGEGEAAYIVGLKQGSGAAPEIAQRLAEQSGLAAALVEDGVHLQAGRVYVCPDGCLMTLEDGHIKAAPAEQPAGERGSIDSLLISLAETHAERAVGIVLAGLGSDGTAGVTALKEHGGLALAERDSEGPDSPLHLADPAGLVDFLLPVEEIPDRVLSYGRHLAATAELADDEEEGRLTKIAAVLRNKTGHDFHGYKRNTFLRRVRRRMQVLQIDDLDAYIEALRGRSDEVEHLFQDLLIGVTEFFRDPTEFHLLEREVVPKLFEGKGAGDQVRVWVLGCATGEEAYSIGILLREHMAGMETVPHVQIFATDIDGRALSMARSGRYPESIASRVSPERLARWFAREGTTYSVVKELREMCIFSQHSVIKDAPFSRIDLISCRNLLIYLTSELQERVIPLFHFALKPSAYLFLGPSENVTRHPKLFSPLNRRHRIFRKLETAARLQPDFPLGSGERRAGQVPLAMGAPFRPRIDAGLGRRAERVAERYAPAYVLVDAQAEVLHFSGRTGRFLEPATGAANLNLFNLVHRDLRTDLRAALHAAGEQQQPVKAEGLRIVSDGEARTMDLVVEPLPGESDASASGFVVLFRDRGPATNDAAASELQPARDAHLQRIEAELRLTRERLQATIEELESTNEELKSSNEEYQSINEELQSANEELETSKEELQSMNEELQTVNAELAHRLADLSHSNSDLKNLLESTQIATVFLDNDLRIKSFTPSVADIFHLIEADLGRPITHIAGRIAYPELNDDVRKVLRSLTPVEREVSTADGDSRFLVRVLPYRSVDNYIAGTVITFLDVTATVRAEAEAAEAGARTREILESIGDAFYALDGEMRFTYVNRRALELWGRRTEDVIGRPVAEILASDGELLAAQTQAVREGMAVEVETLSVAAERWIAASVYPSSSGGVSVYFRDVSERRRAAERQRLLMGELQHRAKNILAVIRSMANRTLETSANLEDFGAHFEGRLSALARTQAVLTRRVGGQIDLEEIVREELLSHAARDDEQVEIDGPPIQLRESAAEILTLALHELATNAVKYGALAVRTGRLSVKWRVMNTSDGRRLSLFWRESGVALVDPSPSRTGFGRDLIERGLPYDLGATTSLEFAPGGVICVIETPLEDPAEGETP
jgi:two-component system CheB/CheR fusion protein